MTRELRDSHIKIRVSASEKREWQRLADDASLSVADLIRASVGRPISGLSQKRVGRPEFTPADPELIRKLANFGNNLNQLARAANTAPIESKHALQIISYLADLQNEIRLIREHYTERGADVDNKDT